MATDLQVAKNRQNAQNSTGPKTQDTKQRTRMNAVKHGIYSSQLLIAGEDSEEFAALECEMRTDLAPEGVFEEMLVEQIIGDFWRLRRLGLAEQAYLEKTGQVLFHAMLWSLSADELSRFAASFPDPVGLRSTFRYDTSPDWQEPAPMTLGRTPKDILPMATKAESKEEIDRLVDQTANLGVTILKAVAPDGGRSTSPISEIDRMRRGLMRDIMQKRAALDHLKERRKMIDAE